jgi:acetoin utilization deacetylase AcuC-like enzyme
LAGRVSVQQESGLARVALVYSEVFLKHDVPGHIENKRRASATYRYLRSKPLHKKLVEMAPRPASVEEITLVHDEGYCRAIMSLPGREFVRLDPDTVSGPGSLEAALRAAGAVTLAVDKVAEDAIDAAFCLVRPPGHHARPARAMGFCIFNNVAIGAAYATRVRGLKRAAIVDFDVHHGNGTQEMFYNDPAVLYCSIHRWPFYPGSGLPDERGEGKGFGKTINVPLPAMSGEEEYLEALEEKILPAVRRHKPSIILISAGFDAHEADLIGGMGLTAESYGKITRAIAEVAREVCDGKMVSALEGGYNLEALAASVHAHLEAML